MLTSEWCFIFTLKRHNLQQVRNASLYELLKSSVCLLLLQYVLVQVEHGSFFIKLNKAHSAGLYSSGIQFHVHVCKRFDQLFFDVFKLVMLLCITVTVNIQIFKICNFVTSFLIFSVMHFAFLVFADTLIHTHLQRQVKQKSCSELHSVTLVECISS